MTPPADVNVAGETAGGRLHDFREDEQFAGLLDDVHVALKDWKPGGTTQPYVAAMQKMNCYLRGCIQAEVDRALARSASQPPAPASRSGDAGGEVAWIRVEDRLPPFDQGERVLVYTDGFDFAGQQFFDVKADELWETDPDRQTEVSAAASHWMPRPVPSHAPDATLAATSGATSGPEAAALLKLCDQLDGMKRRLLHTPYTGQHHSYLMHEDVEAYVEEARAALRLTP